jgi:hypothetical protein
MIQDLVNQFQEIFCHLNVTQVWLLCKCVSGNGFQGWHQYKVSGISNTIMVNLGGSDNDNDNKKKDQNDPTADGPKTFVNKEAALRKEAVGKKFGSSKHLPSRL